MAHSTILNCLFAVYVLHLEISEQNRPKMCTFKPYIDECGNRGWKWNCRNRNIQSIPRDIPDRFRHNSLALDLSGNNFNTISSETFSEVNFELLQNIKALILRYNDLKLVKKFAFSLLRNLCVLDLSSCNLGKLSLANQSFSNLTKLKVLRINHNEFSHLGYPDVEISRLLRLQKLAIGVFEGFHFSDQFQKLTELKIIYFVTENSKFHITNTTFSGLSNSPIFYLRLEFTKMVFCDVSDEVFCSFPFLKGVTIKFGGLCDLNVALRSLKCLQNRTMDYIDASENKQTYVERTVFLSKENCKYLFSICTKKVTLNKNRIAGILDNPLYTRMGQCIEYLDISVNRIATIKPVFVLDFLTQYPRLHVLKVSFIDFQAIVRTMINNSDSYRFPFKKRPIVILNLSKQLILLEATQNHMPSVGLSSVEFSLSGERITELDIADTNLPCDYVAQMQTPSLKFLDMSDNLCSKMNDQVLRFATQLETFFARDVRLGVTDNFKIEKLFHGLKRLKNVDLSNNYLSYLPHTMFEDQKLSLTYLNLDGNELSEIPFSHLEKLHDLFMRSNKISFLAKSDIDKLLTMHKDSKLHIKGNPLSCECAHISSLKWMREHKHRFGDLEATLCVSKTVTMLEFLREETFIVFEKKCQTNLWLTCSSILFVFLLTTVLTAAFVKKYRVHVDYVILRLRSRWKGVSHVVNNKTFPFDAFVSYAEEDYKLACITLYRELIRLGFQISLPDKDFIPGLSKAEQLLQCIDDSRKVIIVVTKKFLESGWDSYAVQMVVTHAFHNHRQKSIIVIIKDGIPVERMPKDLRYIWWSIISIQWPESEENMMTFWEELSNALRSD